MALHLSEAFNRNWPKIQKALGTNDIKILSAAAGTVQVECSGWVPVRERRADPEHQPAIYRLQNQYWDSGFYGRGFIQLTGRDNYKAASLAVDKRLLSNPDLALDADVAAAIFAWFFDVSGAKSHAWNGDLVGVRRAVNGKRMLLLDEFVQYTAEFTNILRGV